MRLISKVSIIGLSTLVIGLFNIAVASAVRNDTIEDPKDEWGIAVSPASFDLKFIPGQTVTETFRIRNLGSNTGTIKVGITPLALSGEQYEKQLTEQTPRTEITRWTTLSMQPGCDVTRTDEDGSIYTTFGYKEECFVDFSVSAPIDAPSGSQHMQIVFEQSSGLEEGGMQHIKAIGGNVYAMNAHSNVDGDGCLNILGRDIPFWTFEAPFTTSARLENCGDLDFYATISMDIRNLFGGEVYTDYKVEPEGNATSGVMVKNVGDQHKIVLAETTRKMEDPWKEANIGIYQVTQTVHALGSDYPVTQWVILAPVWLLILLIAIVLILMVLIIIRICRNRHAAKPAAE